jgi:hypothetical protein
MRQRRAGVRPSPQEPVRPQLEQAEGPHRFIDRSRPHTVEDRFPYPAYLVQDGHWYRWETGDLVGPTR